MPFAVQVRNDATDAAAAGLELGVANDLTVELRNRTGAAIELGDGAEGAVLYLALATCVPAAAIADAKVHADGFAVECVEGVWALRPETDRTVAPGAVLSVAINELKLADMPRVTVPLYVSWRGARSVAADGGQSELPFDGRTAMLQIHRTARPAIPVARPPLAVGWLSEGVGAMASEAARGIVATSAPGMTPVVNRLSFRLENIGGAPLVTTPGGNRPAFAIYCTTVDDAGAPARYDALATVAQWKDVRLSVEDDDASNWQVDWDEQLLQWVLIPQNAAVLYGRESVIVTIDNLITTLPQYPTALYVDYRDLPGYPEGVLELAMEKRAAWPVIGKFESIQGARPLSLGDMIFLRWECWGLPEGYETAINLYKHQDGISTLIADDLPAVYQWHDETFSTPVDEFTYFSLALSVPNAPPEARTRVRIGRVTASLEAVPSQVAAGSPVELRYSYSFASDARIRSPEGEEYSLGGAGECHDVQVVTPQRSTTYTLSADGFPDEASASVDITVV